MKLFLKWMLPTALIALTACDTSRVARPLPSGLVVTDLVIGSGRAAARGDTLVVLFVGRFPDSTVFDGSTRRTFWFRLGAGEVIRGWDLGMPGARVGGTRRLVIPPELAYGAQGVPPIIPPNSTLVYDIQLVEVRAPAKLPWRI
jgi:FKBP-type peptidyl-prolyl cis-trans isomerase